VLDACMHACACCARACMLAGMRCSAWPGAAGLGACAAHAYMVSRGPLLPGFCEPVDHPTWPTAVVFFVPRQVDLLAVQYSGLNPTSIQNDVIIINKWVVGLGGWVGWGG
jgi:hypothetical protein